MQTNLSAAVVRSTPARDTNFMTVAVIFWVAIRLRTGARFAWSTARRIDAWLERRRAVAVTRAALEEMTDRELLDIGITRSDIPRVASDPWEGHPAYPTHRGGRSDG